MPDILVTQRDGVGIVTLNRPEVRNAVTLLMWRELAAIFLDFIGDSGIRAVVLLNGLSLGEGALDVAAAQRMIDRAADSEDFREGRRAFAEKRIPRFRGC